MLVSVGAAVIRVRGALPIRPSVPVATRNSIVAADPTGRSRLARVNSEPFTPVPPIVLLIMLTPAAAVTAPMVSDDTPLTRPKKSRRPPRSVSGVASGNRFGRSSAPRLLSDRLP